MTWYFYSIRIADNRSTDREEAHNMKHPHGIILASLVLLHGCAFSLLSGNFDRDVRAIETLSREAQALVDSAYRDIPPGKLVDCHLHVVGINTAKTGCFVNENMPRWWHPRAYIRYRLFLSAFGVDATDTTDEAMVRRLASLARGMRGGGTFYILAMDKNYNRDGTENLPQTEFYTPNNYVYEISRAHPDIFVPVVSINPYRKDAIAELERWAGNGVRMVKWIPNAQGIDPSDPAIDPFYRRMKALRMALLTHGGEEKAVDAEEAQKLGNPLLLRRPLDIGVTIIVAHGASLGRNIDLDDPEKKPADNFDLFLRLMDEKKYERLLFADVSAQLQFNRLSKPLERILERTDLHHRLVNGSDYPLPAVNVVIQTRVLARLGFITSHERRCLNEIYRANPLLFDFVLKRTIRHPRTGARFPASVFTTGAVPIR